MTGAEEPSSASPPLPAAAVTLGVRELLALPALAGTTVLAGADGLNRSATAVNVMEVPDVLSWVRPGELLVTTGYPLITDATSTSTRAETVVELIHGLAAAGVAAFGVKLGRYLDRLPAAAIDAADEVGLPLLGLPVDLRFDDLIEEVYARVRRSQAEAVARADALHTTLSQLVLSGADVNRIASEVSEVLDVGILVTTTDGRERGGAVPAEGRDRLRQHQLADDTGRVRVERIGSGCPYDDGEARVMPIPAGADDLARLVCLSPERELGVDDVQALERTAIVMALLLTRQRAVALVENKYRGDFLHDVLLGRAGDPTFVLEHARSVGWELDRPVVVLAAEVDPLPATETVDSSTQRMWQERFAAAWRQVGESVDPTMATADFSTEVITLVPAPEDPGDLRGIVDGLVTAVAGDRGGGRRPFSVGVSRVAASVDALPGAYHQARRATRVGRRISGGRATTWFDELGLHRLIALIPDPGEVRRYVADVLGPLAEDSAEAADLRATLQVLLDANLNVAEAARTLFFHYNTMRYRITKLESLLGPFTSDAGLRLDLAVALQALDLD